jgi:hypothetical protein
MKKFVQSLALVGVVSVLGGTSVKELHAQGRQQPTRRTVQRIPPQADMNRQVNLRGKKMPLRDALAQIDPDEKITLRNGTIATFQEIVDAFAEFEKSQKVKLADLDQQVPMPETTKKALEQSQQRLETDQTQRRSLEAQGWRSIIQKSRGGRTFRPRDIKLSDLSEDPQQDSIVPNYPPNTNNLTPIESEQLSTQPQLKNEPAELNWGDQWGDKNIAAVFISMGAGNDFEYLSGLPSVNCAAQATGGVFAFNQKFDLARIVAGSGASNSNVTGAIRVFILGEATPIWKKDGVFEFPKQERKYATPKASVPVGILGPLSLTVDLSASTFAMFTASIQPKVEKNKAFACVATLQPQLRATGTGGGALQFAGLAKKVIDVLAGSFSVGATVNMTLLDLSLPSKLALGVQLNPANSNWPNALTQTLDIGFKSKVLDGSLTGWLNLDMNWWLEPVAALFGIKDGKYSKTLMNWKGKEWTYPLVGVNSSVELVKK